jgi:hypothetical protein
MGNSAFMSDMGILSLGGTVEALDINIRGVSYINGLISITRQLLPTDSIGVHDLTLFNVPAGARVHVESQDGSTTISDEVASGTNGTFVTYTKSIAVYQAGSALNDWRIKVRKGSSSPYYIPYETIMTASIGSSSLYLSMIPDE